jgi:ubiquinone/menaquinone biosynthesis C-methylase UbiE
MNLKDRLEILLQPGIELREVEPGIYSVLPDRGPAHYDRKADAYDRAVRSWTYNKLMWGLSPATYRDFAEKTHEYRPRVVLDAGCGSMTATAAVHARSSAFVVGVDLSLQMLRRAKQRLNNEGATNVVLVQADLSNLPFRSGSFESALFMGSLHLFTNPQVVLESVQRVLQPQAKLHLTSLAKVGRKIGDRYYETLRKMGEVAPGKNLREIQRDLEAVYSGVTLTHQGNMVFATAFR